MQSELFLMVFREALSWLKRRFSTSNTVEDMNDIYKALHESLGDSGAVRAILVYTANGGGRPSSTRPIYYSILHEFCHPDHESIQDSVQNERVRQDYMGFLSQVCTQGSAELKTTSAPAGIKGIYKARGIYESVAHLVGFADHRTFYIVLHFNEKIQDRTVAHEAARACANRIKGVFEREHKVKR